MRVNDSPCKDCKFRVVTELCNCHTICKDYLDYRAAQDKKNADNLIRAVLDAQKRNTVDRFRKRCGTKYKCKE